MQRRYIKICQGVKRNCHVLVIFNPLKKTNVHLGVAMVIIVWHLDSQLPVQSVHITTEVVSSNPTEGEVCSIQHYVIKFVSDLRQVSGFLRVLWFPPPINWPPRYTCNWNILVFFLHLSVKRRWGMTIWETEAVYFLVIDTFILSYSYPIFSLRKILYSYMIFVISGLTPWCGLLHNGLMEKKVIFLQFANIERRAFTGIHIIVKHCVLYSTFYGRPVFPVLFQHKYCINVPINVYGAAVGEI